MIHLNNMHLLFLYFSSSFPPNAHPPSMTKALAERAEVGGSWARQSVARHSQDEKMIGPKSGPQKAVISKVK